MRGATHELIDYDMKTEKAQVVLSPRFQTTPSCKDIELKSLT